MKNIYRLEVFALLVVLVLAIGPSVANGQEPVEENTNFPATKDSSQHYLPLILSNGDNNSQAKILYSDDPNVIEGEYIVVLKDDLAKSRASSTIQSLKQQVTAQGGNIEFTYSAALNGFAGSIPPKMLASLQNNPDVAYIEANRVMSLDLPSSTSTGQKQSQRSTDPNPPFVPSNNEDNVESLLATQVFSSSTAEIKPATTQYNVTWGLDRIGQRGRNLNGVYAYDYTGAGVNVYVLDSGIRATHSEFEGRVRHVYSAVADGWGANDCNGHGTHVAGTIGGKTYGVAKHVILNSVRVLNCQGVGTVAYSMAGVDWVTRYHNKPAVANMSLGGAYSTALNNAVQNSINVGVTYVVASGNEGAFACYVSPASAFNAITVGASDRNDRVAGFSNAGPCVDIIAPGVDITSAWYTSNYATNTIEGTSMAAPHVTGVVAMYLQKVPTALPAQVTNALINAATLDYLSALYGEPNLLLHSNVDTDCLLAYHRYYSTGGHFYTTGWGELGGGQSGYAYEGVLAYLATQGCASEAKPLYRYYHPQRNGRFYTMDFNELGYGYAGWNYEGIVGYLLPNNSSNYQTLPVYRYYSPYYGRHFYTKSFNELGYGTSLWAYEGVVGYVFSTSYRQ